MNITVHAIASNRRKAKKLAGWAGRSNHYSGNTLHARTSTICMVVARRKRPVTQTQHPAGLILLGSFTQELV